MSVSSRSDRHRSPRPRYRTVLGFFHDPSQYAPNPGNGPPRVSRHGCPTRVILKRARRIAGRMLKRCRFKTSRARLNTRAWQHARGRLRTPPSGAVLVRERFETPPRRVGRRRRRQLPRPAYQAFQDGPRGVLKRPCENAISLPETREEKNSAHGASKRLPARLLAA